MRRTVARCAPYVSLLGYGLAQEISVKLSTLDTPPETVEAAIRPHIHRNI